MKSIIIVSIVVAVIAVCSCELYSGEEASTEVLMKNGSNLEFAKVFLVGDKSDLQLSSIDCTVHYSSESNLLKILLQNCSDSPYFLSYSYPGIKIFTKTDNSSSVDPATPIRALKLGTGVLEKGIPMFFDYPFTLEEQTKSVIFKIIVKKADS